MGFFGAVVYHGLLFSQESTQLFFFLVMGKGLFSTVPNISIIALNGILTLNFVTREDMLHDRHNCMNYVNLLTKRGDNFEHLKTFPYFINFETLKIVIIGFWTLILL